MSTHMLVAATAAVVALCANYAAGDLWSVATMCLCVCVRAYVRVCLHACVRACVRACVCVYVHVRGCMAF